MEEKERAELMRMMTEKLRRKDSDGEIVARAWATELDKMDERQEILAKHFIGEILMRGRLGELSPNCYRYQPNN